LAQRVVAGEVDYDLVEVMACPGGCIGGAGQPVAFDGRVRQRRAQGLYDADKMLHVHKSQENPYVTECYASHLGKIGGEKAHALLHTHYHSRRRIEDETLPLTSEAETETLPVSVCVGTSCLLRGSQDLLRALVGHLEETGLDDQVNVRATFCFERCDRGPTVRVGNTVIERCTLEKAQAALAQELNKEKEPVG
jgi:NADH-quinone oxidoreductase subunit G